MKVFFTASARGTVFYAHYYKLIYDELEKLHHTNLDNDILTLHSVSYYHNLEKQGEKAQKELYKKKLSSLQKADLCIFEVSLPSTSLGFLTAKALESHKPTIALYLTTNNPYFLNGIHDDKLVMSAYEEKTIRKVVQNACIQAQKKRDQRFNFFINTDLIGYLEKAAQEEKVSKSLYIRKLLEQDMKKKKSP